jgi:hypothetical protein
MLVFRDFGGLPDGGHVDDRAPVLLAAVLEPLPIKVLKFAGNAAREHEKARISPRRITLAISNDEERTVCYPRSRLRRGALFRTSTKFYSLDPTLSKRIFGTLPISPGERFENRFPNE